MWELCVLDENPRWKNKWKNIVLLFLDQAAYNKLLIVIFPEKLYNEKCICMALGGLGSLLDYRFLF